MTTPVILPSLGAGVIDVTVLRWMKAVGEPIRRGETLVEVETDKIATEICAEADGTVLEIGPAVGDRVPTGAVLAVIGPARAAPMAPPTPATAPANQQPAITHQQSHIANRQSPIYSGPVSPVVSRLVAEHRLDLNAIAGTGQDGRITKQDVLAHLERRATAPALAAPLIDPDEPDGSEIEPVSVMRSRIAEHMVASQRAAPHVTTVWEVDLGGVMADRAAQKAEAERAGIRLTPLAYVVCAVAGALREHTAANSQWRSAVEGRAGIAHMRDVHLGLAVAVDAGLLVPVIHHADTLNVMGAARAIHDLATRARAGALTPADMQGATFTLSNHGVAGSLLATPIIPQPQSGILGLGAVEKRARVVTVNGTDAIAIRPCAYLSYTFDHRILDGATADAFMASVKARLEAW